MLEIKSYVKRQGRFTDAQKKSYETLADKFIIPFSQNYINFEQIFANNASVTAEIGFGSGFATAEIAQVNSGKNYLGIEVHKPGIGRLLWEIENRSLSNIRIIEYDAAEVFKKMIPPDSLDAIHIFFPDPWQKRRHRKRRLVQKPFTEIMSCCLKPNGYIYMVTDWEDYAFHALEELGKTAALKNTSEGFAEPQPWRPKTKFEQKALNKSHVIRELLFRKI
ncbi:MAG: tRNA (guanosine(46)-N7)-methyltransferase TrmB [Treponema sp.]|nr:tRNA (guanosine(46)-N7)-methyltransferase TrmB [Treponema sp.]